MYSPLNGKLPASSASTNILAALQRSNDANGDAPSFSNMLQQTHRAPSREPASPPQAQANREPARSAQRAAERQPASTQARDESAARPAPSRDKSDVGAANGSGASAQADADGATDTTGEAAATAATPTDEASTANAAADTSTNPASLAELSAILAALAATHAALVPNGAAAPQDAEATDGHALATGEGLDATRAEIEAAIDKLPKELQAAARALVNLPGAAQQAGMDDANANAATADTAALQAADAAAKDAKPSAANSAAQVTTVAQVGAATQNQAPQAVVTPTGGGELAAASALAQGTRTGRSEAQAVQQLPVFTPAGHKAWAEDVGNRLIWMANRGESRAELVLTPPSLGKLGVSIQVSGDQTTAQFVAATPAAREALEQAMPRLRELLQQAGINLGQTDVSTSPEQQARDGQGDGRGSPRRGGSDAGAAVEGLERPLSQVFSSGAIGLVDTFA